MRNVLLAILLFAAPLPAFAQADCTAYRFELEPAVVGSDEDDAQLVIGGWCGTSAVPYAPRLSVEGDTIFIDLSLPDAGVLVPHEWAERIELPRLFAGEYEVVIRAEGERLETVTVAGNTIVVYDRPIRVAPSFGGAGTNVLVEGVAGGCREAQPCVLFGSAPANVVSVTERGDLVVAVPPGAGLVDVTVHGAERSYTAEAAFRYGAPSNDQYERVLFPVNFTGRGAHGSDWHTDIAIRNDAPITIDTAPSFWADPDSPILPLPTAIPPGAKGRFPEAERDGGAFLHVPRGLESRLAYASHIVDRSRTSTDLGTEVPVVRAEDTSRAIELLEVPVGGRYRAKLRVYDFDDHNGRLVRITFRDFDSGAVVHHAQLTLTGAPVCADGPCLKDRPAFGVLDLEQIPALADRGAIAVTIEGDLNDARLWAFVSVTNNETQHVTLYTPQQ